MAPARGSLAGGHGPHASAMIRRRVALSAAVIMPAATVLLVLGSIRMNAPVERFSP
jgi:hypothetical protein